MRSGIIAVLTKGGQLNSMLYVVIYYQDVTWHLTSRIC